jgi:hypothetical protein
VTQSQRNSTGIELLLAYEVSTADGSDLMGIALLDDYNEAFEDTLFTWQVKAKLAY